MSQDKRMSADYQREVSDFVRNNVMCCVSSLVSDVAMLVRNADRDTLRQTSFDEDDLQDLMQSEDWETPGREKIGEMDRDDLIQALDDAGVEDDRPSNERGNAAMEQLVKEIEDGDFDPAIDGSIEQAGFERMEQWPGLSDDRLRERLEAALDEEADGWKNFCNEHSVDAEHTDVYEHWAVDSWFGRKLAEHGETVEDFGNLTVWGRCTTGQSISMDYVVCQIYDELHEHHQEQSA